MNIIETKDRDSRYKKFWLEETAKNDRLMRNNNKREEHNQRNLNIIRNRDKITLTMYYFFFYQLLHILW